MGQGNFSTGFYRLIMYTKNLNVRTWRRKRKRWSRCICTNMEDHEGIDSGAVQNEESCKCISKSRGLKKQGWILVFILQIRYTIAQLFPWGQCWLKLLHIWFANFIRKPLMWYDLNHSELLDKLAALLVSEPPLPELPRQISHCLSYHSHLMFMFTSRCNIRFTSSCNIRFRWESFLDRFHAVSRSAGFSR